MAALYQDRLNKLIFGYNNKIVNTPNDISMCIIAYTKSKDNLIVNEIISQWEFNTTTCTLEIYLDEFTAKVLDASNKIDKYQIEYKSLSNNSVTTNEIGEQGLAFICFKLKRDFSSAVETKFYARVQALNGNDECILQSGWMNLGAGDGAEQLAQQDIAYKYFEENIDKNGKGSVNINEWIDVLTGIKGFDDFNVWEMKCIFYLIMYLKRKATNTKKNEEMNQQDFFRFLREDESFGYKHVYREFMNVLLDEVPDLMKQISINDIEYSW